MNKICANFVIQIDKYNSNTSKKQEEIIKNNWINCKSKKEISEINLNIAKYLRTPVFSVGRYISQQNSVWIRSPLIPDFVIYVDRY